MTNINILKKIPIFQNFKKSELEAIVKNSYLSQLKEKEALFSPGDTRGIFYIVLKGGVAILKKMGADSEKIMNIVTPGEYITEHALFDPKSKHSHGAIAYNQGVTILCLPGKLFTKLSQDIRYKILHNLLPTISDNFSHASNRIITLLHIGQLLGGSQTNVATLGKQILKQLLQVISAEKGVIAVKDLDSKRARITSTIGFNKKNDPLGTAVLLADDIILNTTINNGKILDLSISKYLAMPKRVSYVSKSVLAIPLQYYGETIGCMALIDKKNAKSFNSNNEVLLTIVSQMVSLGIKQTQQQQTQLAEEELKREYINL